MALTLGGPRLWILIKAFLKLITDVCYANFKIRGSRASYLPTCYPGTNPVFGGRQDIELAQRGSGLEIYHAEVDTNLALTNTSHTELSAAMSLFRKVWCTLNMRSVEFQTSVALSSGTGWRPSAVPIRRMYRNLIMQPLDIASSLLMSAAFIAMFVAESSGSVLSGHILSDSIALSNFPGCLKANRTDHQVNDVMGYNDYSERCYHAEAGADGCAIFFKQSIPCVEKANDECLLSDHSCLRGLHGPVTFDTGLVRPSFLGINTASRVRLEKVYHMYANTLK